MNFRNHTKAAFSRLRIKHIFLIILLIISVIAVFAFFCVRSLTSSLAYRQIDKTNQSVLSFVSQNLNTSVSQIDQEFYYLLNSNPDTTILETMSTDFNHFHAASSLVQAIKRIYESSGLLEMVFLYSPAGETPEYLLYSDQLFSVSDSTVLKEHSMKLCESSLSGSKLPSTSWFNQEINGIPYLTRIVRIGQTFCGGFIRLSALLEQLNTHFRAVGSCTIFSSDGQWLCGDHTFSAQETVSLSDTFTLLQKDREQYIVSVATPQLLDICIAMYLPVSQLPGSIFQDYIDFIFICFLLILLTVLIYICFVLMNRPFLYLSRAMQIIIQDNPNFRIEKKSYIYEASQIYDTFNHMLDELEHLKSELYEKEKVVRQFLQTQLKSHFFLNCLNIIYSMAQTGRYNLIQKLSMCLVKHFRYLSLNSEELIPLRKELEHINNYMEIQQLRFPGKITYQCNIKETLYDCPIPLLMLHTFLENSVQYGRNDSAVSSIILSAEFALHQEKKGILFMIRDCGKGFSDELLAFYRQEHTHVTPGYEHGIGILNIQSRLHFIYKGDEFLEITNHVSGGAQIKIWLPIDNNYT
ncbi:hypothetical protein D7Y05_01375 [bacterium 1XD42-54]|nr:hypothetical protein D7Y05_01375 [bacterium 1XD42-54]